MKIELLKELIGDKIDQCTDENFKEGYNPITDIIDQLEIDMEPSFDDEKSCEDYWEETEIFLYEMKLVKPTDENYRTIYNIDFYGNIFYYSKAAADIFMETWNSWDGDFLYGGKTRKWFYYFVDRMITRDLELEEKAIMEGLYELTPAGFVPSIEDDPNYEQTTPYDDCPFSTEYQICELEDQCIDSSFSHEIEELENFLHEQNLEDYDFELYEEPFTDFFIIRAEHTFSNLSEKKVFNWENKSIEPDDN